MMPTIFTSGHSETPLLFIKVKLVSYQSLKKNDGKELIETVAECLPRGSMTTYRSETARVGKENLRWAKHFGVEIQ